MLYQLKEMADIVKCVSKREIFPECSTSMQRDHVVTDLLVHSLRHTFTLHVCICFCFK
jgi:hypothetical protein